MSTFADADPRDKCPNLGERASVAISGICFADWRALDQLLVMDIFCVKTTTFHIKYTA